MNQMTAACGRRRAGGTGAQGYGGGGGQELTKSEADRRLRRALVELALGAAVAAILAVVVEQRLGSPTPRSAPALALILLLGCWLIVSITWVPVGVDRAGRVQSLNGVNALLFPAALLLPPAAFLPVAALSLAPQLTNMGAAKATGNASIRIIVVSATAATFTVVNDGPGQSSAQSWLDWRTITALVCAATVMLLTESVAIARTLHTTEAMTSADLPLIDPVGLMSDSLDVAIGALICVLHGTPSGPDPSVTPVRGQLLRATSTRGEPGRAPRSQDRAPDLGRIPRPGWD